MTVPTSPESGINLKTFFEEIPSGVRVAVEPPERLSSASGIWFRWNVPELNLHCQTDSCDGIRFFRSGSTLEIREPYFANFYVLYGCKNCGKAAKTFAIVCRRKSDKATWEMCKFGEMPEFGPPTPSRLISLIGPKRDYFLKGRRAENQGLGIAAFAYYRRVIDDQKNRILDEIIRVSKHLSASPTTVEELERAKNETQFSKAVESIKHGIPQALLINGHNPLTLLYSALSEGLHEQTDEQCLELATSIRTVMAELAERLAQALKDDAELNTAVTRLLNKKKSAETAATGASQEQFTDPDSKADPPTVN